MNAPHRNARPSALIADASKVSPTQFLAVALDHFMPAPLPTRESEQADAARRYINAAWASDDVPALRAAYEREKDEIDARWQLSEVRAARHFGRTGVGA